eukprot:6308623-Pyramimonas_sp.AAC.1
MAVCFFPSVRKTASSTNVLRPTWQEWVEEQLAHLHALAAARHDGSLRTARPIHTPVLAQAARCQ